MHRLSGIVGSKKLGAVICNYPSDSCKFPLPKFALKTTNDYHFEFTYCMCRKNTLKFNNTIQLSA